MEHTLKKGNTNPNLNLKEKGNSYPMLSFLQLRKRGVNTLPLFMGSNIMQATHLK